MNKKFKFYPYKMHWYEGMPLSPHHFQQLDEINSNINSYLTGKMLPNHWGIVHLDLDVSNIKDDIIRIEHLEVIFENREILFLPANKNEQTVIKFKKELETANNKEGLKVFIAIPKSNYTYESESHNQGYKITQKNDVEDYNNGNNSTCVFHLEPNYKIFFNEIPFNYVGVQICTIHNTPLGAKLGEYDPPCLDIENANHIVKKAKKLVKILKEKTIHVKKQININNSKYSSSTINSIFMQGILPVEYLLYSSNIHPNQLFGALINLIGHISIFNQELIFHDIPFYDHTKLLQSFAPLFNVTKQIIDTIKDPYVLHPFVEKDALFSIPANKLSNEIFLLFSYSSNIEIDDAIQWAKSCVISSESIIDTAIETRVLGAQREVEVMENKSLKQIIVRINPQTKFIMPSEDLHICNPSSEIRPDVISLIEFIAD